MKHNITHVNIKSTHELFNRHKELGENFKHLRGIVQNDMVVELDDVKHALSAMNKFERDLMGWRSELTAYIRKNGLTAEEASSINAMKILDIAP